MKQFLLECLDNSKAANMIVWLGWVFVYIVYAVLHSLHNGYGVVGNTLLAVLSLALLLFTYMVMVVVVSAIITLVKRYFGKKAGNHNA